MRGKAARPAGGTLVAPGHPAATGEPDAADGEAIRMLEHQLGVLLRRSRALSAEVGRAVHPELEPGAYGILVRVAEVAPARPSDLAAYFGVGKATMSRQVKGLEGLGLVEREPDPADGRAHLLSLTGEGRRRLDRARTARRRRFDGLLGTWPQDDVRLLAGMLARLNALMDPERDSDQR
ncbi:MarR family winged helix-turn-helix transcriptional regulator [Sphaerisporangium rufum]|uniref:MarR family winged helix-turn-helix transcriptional regulator n=1 Tax=Sphaerisporangium rufum TaxID=1381558 RepID=UPI0019513E04|nr:MarR family winged helix-turn-helix transcriptional regulator [Sphaerisporangium rufum]